MRIILTVVFLLALAGPAWAGLAEGRQAYLDGNWEKAIAELRPLADTGDNEAQFLLGNMYNDGNGVLRDHRKAMELLTLSAEQENPLAMVSVATMYATGLGVERSWQEAVNWYQRAAMINNQTGQFFLALFLLQGEPGREGGASADKKGAYKWFRLATMSNQLPNIKDMAGKFAYKLAEDLTTDEVTAIEAEIKAWKPALPPSVAKP